VKIEVPNLNGKTRWIS